MKCLDCPRDGERRLQAVRNFGRLRGYLLEVVTLCESCALLREEVL